MGAYDTAGWADFFVAAAGATAALTGLVFVGVSINLARILEFAVLPNRAGQTLILLANALIATLLLLGPVREGTALGLQVLAISLTGWAGATTVELRSTGADMEARHCLRWAVSSQLATLPFVVAGISIVVGFGGGLYWLLAGVGVALIVGLLNAWILLVEILR